MHRNPLFTSTSDAGARSELVVFARWFCLQILLPALIGVLAVEFVGWRTGTTMTPTALAATQREDSRIVWGDQLQDYALIKLQRIKEEQPDIVLIGHSRAHQIRSAMFKPYSFYNLTPSIASFDQITILMKKVMEVSHPKIIMFTLDYYMFLNQWAGNAGPLMVMHLSYPISDHLYGIVRLAEFAKQRPLTVLRSVFRHAEVAGIKLLGVEAIRGKVGFRFDGSLMYPYGAPEVAEGWINEWHNGLLAAAPGGAGLDPEQVSALAELSAVAKSRGVLLVGVQTPIYKTTIDALDRDDSYRPYAEIWRQFQSAKTQQMLKDMGIRFFDLSRDPVNEDFRNFADSGHPGERAMLGAFVHQLGNPDFIDVFPKLDGAALRERYARAQREGSYRNVYNMEF
jgi:hypothetical protein